MEGERIRQYQILSQIGRGAFSTVYLAIHLPTECKVAIKVIQTDSLHPDDFCGILREISSLLLIDHPNIATLYDYFIEDSVVFLVLEYLGGGTLFDRIKIIKHLSEEEARKYFIGIMSAISYLHEGRMLAHRDIKPQNILLTESGEPKLIDFGFCCCFASGWMDTFCGSPGFTAPEVIKGGQYNQLCDVWSLGVLLYTMVVGHHPFDLQNNNYDQLCSQIDTLSVPDTLSPMLQHLIRSMLVADPTKRSSLSSAASHMWVWESLTSLDCFRYPTVHININCCKTLEDTKNLRRRPLLKVDRKVVALASGTGIESKTLSQELRRGEVSPNTATYFILSKNFPQNAPILAIPPKIDGDQISAKSSHQQVENLPINCTQNRRTLMNFADSCSITVPTNRKGGNLVQGRNGVIRQKKICCSQRSKLGL